MIPTSFSPVFHGTSLPPCIHFSLHAISHQINSVLVYAQTSITGEGNQLNHAFLFKEYNHKITIKTLEKFTTLNKLKKFTLYFILFQIRYTQQQPNYYAAAKEAPVYYDAAAATNYECKCLDYPGACTE